jgi:hypothetical protein
MNEVCGNCLWRGKASSCSFNPAVKEEAAKKEAAQSDKDKQARDRNRRQIKRDLAKFD